MNPIATGLFLLFVVITLYVSYWAAKRTRTRGEFYTAGGRITALQNGAAIAGDYSSAAMFLGITALFFSGYVDGMVIVVSAFAAWPLMIILSERVRNLGRYTFIDVVSYRLAERPVRILFSISTVVIIITYLILQMVAAGSLVEVLFGVPYEVAEIVVGVLVVVYVAFGGMLATTWVQIIKAVLLITGISIMFLLLMTRVDFDVDSLVQQAIRTHENGPEIVRAGALYSGVQALTVAVTMMFGSLGLPHILMRLFTVKDSAAARQSVMYASMFVGYVVLMLPVLGFGTIVFVSINPEYFEAASLAGGSNMAAVHLSHALGGEWLIAFIAAVAFATILAVVAGLTIAGAAAVAHDIYACVLCDGDADSNTELSLSRYCALTIGILSVLLGIVFKGQNIAFIGSMPMVLAASVCFPVLITSLYWEKLTTKGALAGGSVGLVSGLILIILGPLVWVDIFGFDEPLFPYTFPGLFSMSLAFLTIWLVSIGDRSEQGKADRAGYLPQLLKCELQPALR